MLKRHSLLGRLMEDHADATGIPDGPRDQAGMHVPNGSLATPEPRQAVVVRADIGSAAWGLAASGREASRGGFGEVLGDDGSAYWIGRKAIRVALKAHEKRYRNTLLKSRLLTHFGVSSTPHCGT